MHGQIFLNVDENTGSSELIFEYSLYLNIFSELSKLFSHPNKNNIIIANSSFNHIIYNIKLYLQKK